MKMAILPNSVLVPSVVLAQIVATPGRVLSGVTPVPVPVLQSVAGVFGCAVRGFCTRKPTVQPPLTVLQPPMLEVPMAPRLVWNTTGVPSGTGLLKASASSNWIVAAGWVGELSMLPLTLYVLAVSENARCTGWPVVITIESDSVEMSAPPLVPVFGSVAWMRNDFGVLPELTVVT